MWTAFKKHFKGSISSENREEKILNTNYAWQNKCTHCMKNFHKEYGIWCPDCNQKLRTTSHDTKRVEHKRY